MNVIVIGGGASGLMAAITAAKGGHSVTLLERQARVGRKLLSTGNGRCNLTNLNMGLPYYHGQDAAFIRPAFEALSLDATLDFFHSLGLLTTAEDNGGSIPTPIRQAAYWMCCVLPPTPPGSQPAPGLR